MITHLVLRSQLEIPSVLPRMIQRYTWMKELSLHFYQQQPAIYQLLVAVIVSLPSLEKLTLQPNYLHLQNFSQAAAVLMTNRTLRSLILDFGVTSTWRQEHDIGAIAEVVAKHLSSDSCSLTQLEITFGKFAVPPSPRLHTADMASLLLSLRSNRTLESLIIRRCLYQQKCIDASWTNVLVSSLDINKTLWNLEIPSLHLENDLDGILAYYCTRNRFHPVLKQAVSQISNLLPRILELLLTSPMGTSVMFSNLRQGKLLLGRSDCWSIKRKMGPS